MNVGQTILPLSSNGQLPTVGCPQWISHNNKHPDVGAANYFAQNTYQTV